MTEIYRLTVRTVDGTLFISDYEDEHIARNMMDKFFVTDKNLLSYKWCEGNDKAWIKLDKVCSATVKKVAVSDTGFEDNAETPDTRLERKTARYVGIIHVVEAN